MTPPTHVHDAESHARSERDAVDAKLDAFDRFVERVEDCDPTPTPASATGAAAAVGTVTRCGRSAEDQCAAVRQAFAETVRPHSLDDVDGTEPLRETIEAELSESIAVALAPATKTAFSPTLKRAVVSAARDRRAETAVLRRALDREIAQLTDARAVVDDVREWIASADETPLTDLGFDALHRRHERLAAFRDRCSELAEQRQVFLDGATNGGPDVGVSHRDLVPHVYRDLPVDHPVLATVARLDGTCAECQRAVRRHLTGRA